MNFTNRIAILLQIVTATTFVSAEMPLVISQSPISAAILEDQGNAGAKNDPLFVLDRARYSTCTGVAWTNDDQTLFGANLIESSLHVYHFKDESLLFSHCLRNKGLSRPENLVFSPCGTLLAVPNQKGFIKIFKVDPLSSKINSISNVKVDDGIVHGVNFSKDFKYLACVSLNHGGMIRIFKIHENKNELKLIPTFKMKNKLNPLKPKGIDFSPDGRFLAICYSKRAAKGEPKDTNSAALEIFELNNGKIKGRAISHIDSSDSPICVPEDVRFFPTSSCLMVSNQGNDTITLHTFNQESGIIENSYVALKNPEAQLNFPHGIAISSQGKYLAVSNYGDNKISIYKMNIP